MRPCPALFALSLFSIYAAEPDLLVVGAGVAGLSAALEAARAGLRVTVVDRNTVPGGHAVISSGGVAIVGTPVQERLGVRDTPELARADFLRWGEDASEPWVRAYTERSRAELYDWLTSLGTEFVTATLNGAGSSVARFHVPKQQGLGLVLPLYRELLRYGNVTWRFHTLVTGLTFRDGRATGIAARELRSGKAEAIAARQVLLATGGFANNLDLVRASWPKSMPVPERILVGGGFFANGEGMEWVRAGGGTSARLDHQWNYATGLPDPFDAEGKRGHFVAAVGAIWVNPQGRRFAKEQHEPKTTIPIIAAQRPARFWAVFDAEGRKGFRIVHAGYGADRLEAVFNVPGFIHRAETLDELARLTGMDAAALRESVAAEKGRIAKPPFYAAPMFVLIRKSLGGIAVDEACRVLTADGRTIPGLLAAGEATGFGGLHGKNGIEGAFLGGSIFMGRVAARTVAGEAHRDPERPGPAPSLTPPAVRPEAANQCRFCHDLPELTAQKREGYWHFERSHKLVVSRGFNCTTCHAEMAPYNAETHAANRALRTTNCVHCHTNPPRN